MSTIMKPILNIQATTLADLNNREDAKELALACSLRSNQLRNIITTPTTVPLYPANTQGVECVVKKV